MSDTQKRGRKYDQVLQGAKEVFFEHGFEGASVDEIARVAGVSKATLYSYFPNKQTMFAAVARAKYQAQADLAISEMDINMCCDDCLRIAAHKMVFEFLTEFSRSIFRVAVGEAARFPKLSKEFYDGGPRLVRGALMPFLQAAVDRKELVIDDLELAADQFAELCKTRLFPEYMLGIRDDFTDAEKGQIADEAVKTFLARYKA